MQELQNLPENQTDFYLNPAQIRCILADPKELYALLGRGTGKSTEILGHLTLNRVFDMPRATFLILGRTYKQIKTRTLPGTVMGWEKRGMIEGKHFVIGRKPPSNWPRSYFAPVDDYSHFISFYTGTGFHLGSQDRPGLVNSLTVWGIFGDEAKLLNEERFKEDAAATNRGNLDAFPGNPHNRGIWLTSSMPPIPEGNWLYSMEERMDPKQVQDILKLALFIEQQKQLLSKTSNQRSRNGIQRKLNYLEKWLRYRQQGSIYYTEASSLANIHILRTDHIKQMQEILKGKFNTEILNLRPKHAINSFYAKLQPRHFYNDFNYSHYDGLNYRQASNSDTCKGDNDLVKGKKLIIGFDFGARINCIVTAQKFDSIREIRFIKNHFVTSPHIIDDVCKDWCDYYSAHGEREVDMWYDATGNNRVPNSRITYAQQAKKILEANGWTVNLKTKGGSNPFHNRKFLLWNLMLLENDRRLYRIRINETNCQQLKSSMQFAPTKEDRNGEIHKDKSSERKKTIPAEEATDLSDAADNIVFGEFDYLINDFDLSYHDVMIR